MRPKFFKSCLGARWTNDSRAHLDCSSDPNKCYAPTGIMGHGEHTILKSSLHRHLNRISQSTTCTLSSALDDHITMLSLNAFSSFRLAAIPLVSILFSSGILPAQALEVGEQFCVEGFVMDFYCINRGTLLDNQSVRTLVGPDLHSVHCLVDVERCVATDYEILLDPLPGETLYARGWRLDDATKGRVIELARSIGSCRTCDTPGGLVQGMRAALNATVLDLGSSSVPPRISATEIQVSELGVPFCADTTSEFVPRAPPNRITSAGTDLQKKYYAHASCMLIGFGWLLPTGAIFARLFKHRPNGLWFKIHLPLQIIGLIFAISGWVSACMYE
jgi:hypothetical protein